ncbi:MAG: adenylate/guanylate cyclase domain-containing protein [Caldilineaceae bacterium]
MAGDGGRCRRRPSGDGRSRASTRRSRPIRCRRSPWAPQADGVIGWCPKCAASWPTPAAVCGRDPAGRGALRPPSATWISTPILGPRPTWTPTCVLGVLARYDGVLIQLTTGDKGSYPLTPRWCCVAHDDDIGRVRTAQIPAPPATLAYRPVPQIGLAHGRMRAGPYGSATRRTYGVQGAAVNPAARLMMQAEPGAIVVEAATAALLAQRALTPLSPVTLKGHAAPSTPIVSAPPTLPHAWTSKRPTSAP